MEATTDTITDTIIGGLTAAGYQPIDAIETGSAKTDRTLDYFCDRGWTAARVLCDSIQLVRWSEDGCLFTSTSLTGCIDTEARFSWDRHGVRMFLVAAELRP